MDPHAAGRLHPAADRDVALDPNDPVAGALRDRVWRPWSASTGQTPVWTFGERCEVGKSALRTTIVDSRSLSGDSIRPACRIRLPKIAHRKYE